MHVADRQCRVPAPILVLTVLLVGARPLDAQAEANYQELQMFSSVLNHIRINYEVLDPFLRRVRERLAVAAPGDSALDAALARRLAARVALVRWGAEARDELLLSTDPVLIRAREEFSRLPALLAGPAK